VSYEGTGRFSLPDEHAIHLTDETSPACVIGAFEIAVGAVYATDTIAERFRTGGGFSWGDHDEHVLGGCERFFRPGYLNHLASTWIPTIDGVEAKLTDGAAVADVGCGHGASTLLLADAYPASAITGFDAHDGSIEAARKRAADAGLAERVRFEVASATSFSGTYDLVCFFDCLHDMGDPAGACAHARARLAPGGTLMLIEPFAADDIGGNLNPVGAAYYGFSTLLCTPSSLSQEAGTALGAQAGEARLREIVTSAGFATLRRVPGRAATRPGRPGPLPAHGGIRLVRAGHGELRPARDRGVRRVPGRDQRWRADVPQPGRAPRRRSVAVPWNPVPLGTRTPAGRRGGSRRAAGRHLRPARAFDAARFRSDRCTCDHS
jgi:SAM-dependent methyltransferase